jgi:hypothetical protein
MQKIEFLNDICAFQSPVLSAANLRFRSNAAQARRLSFDPIAQGSGRELRLGPVRGRAQFCGRHPWSATKQLLKAGLGRSSMKPNGSTLLDRGV